MSSIKVGVRVVDSVSDIDPADWDACACPIAATHGGRPDNPFATHRFFKALEESGSAAPETGWAPCHFVVHELDDADGLVGPPLGLMPAYLKSHSRGEYVFDHGWADAFERAGGRYYPKIQACAPFTPATGRRFLRRADARLDDAELSDALMRGAAQFADNHGVSGVHVTFCAEDEWRRYDGRDWRETGVLMRQDQQFHWEDQGYGDFEGFLGGLASRKRKQLKKERAKAVENGIEILRLTGDDIADAHWDAMWLFYQDTGARKWGVPYLTRRCFEMFRETMADDVLMVMCRRDGEYVAGALNFIGRETLFGRYWGCQEHHPFLHFEVCYYQAIDAAFELGLGRVEAGAQGAHKLARGYLPTATYSLHWIAHPGLRRAVAEFLDHERRAVDQEIALLAEYAPYRKDAAAEER